MLKFPRNWVAIFLFIFFALAATFLFSPACFALELTLERAKIIALENNRDVKVGMRSVDSARGELTSRKGAYDPSFTFSASYRDAKTPTTITFIEDEEISEKILSFGSELSGKLPTGTFYKLYDLDVRRTETNSPLESLSPVWNASLGFSVGQELLRGFGLDSDRVSVTVSSRDRDISVYEFERVVASTLFEVEKDYWNVIAATRGHDLEKKAYELALDLENRTRIRYEAGVLPRVALTQAASETAARKVTLINSENRLAASMDVLRNRLALPLDEELEIESSPSVPYVASDEASALKRAFESRPELRRAKKEVEKNEVLKSFHSRQRLPSLSVEGKLEYAGTGGEENPSRIIFGDTFSSDSPRFDDPSDAYSNIRDREFPDWSVTGTLSFPLFNKEARGAYARASAELQKSLINYEKQKDEVRLEVRNAVRELESGARRIEAARLSAKLAAEVLRNEEEKFKAGLSTAREILEAQRDMVRAEAEKISALAAYSIALAELERAKGTITASNSLIVENAKISSWFEIE